MSYHRGQWSAVQMGIVVRWPAATPTASRGAALITNLWFIVYLMWFCLAICLTECVLRWLNYYWWYTRDFGQNAARCDRCKGIAERWQTI